MTDPTTQQQGATFADNQQAIYDRLDFGGLFGMSEMEDAAKRMAVLRATANKTSFDWSDFATAHELDGFQFLFENGWVKFGTPTDEFWRRVETRVEAPR